MNIKILDSWLRDYLKTRVEPKKLAEALSLTSVSVEKIEDFKNDKVYDIEVTTNRPDLMSVVGLAREASAVLPEFDIQAEFSPPHLSEIPSPENGEVEFTVKNDSNLINRICAVVLEVEVKESPQEIQNRLESTGIRSLNNVIDITNYLMREMGHPTHVFDFDRLGSTHLTITTSQKGSVITTLDKKSYNLQGGDIVAVNNQGEIVDLIGVMGLDNSIVTKKTKRVVLFIDNNNPDLIRRTSLTYGIRTEAAILNEKNIDPELAMQTLKRGVELYKKYANGKVISKVLDIYPNKAKERTVKVSMQKLRDVIGVDIPQDSTLKILRRLGFTPTIENNTLTVIVPTWREEDVTIGEDVIEEVARVYGYHKIPSILPNVHLPTQKIHNTFYWEKKAKDALLHWGFTEVYTYSMVGEDLLEVAPKDSISLTNPLTEDHAYMRTKLVPSLLQVIYDNPNRDEIKVFELANIYLKKNNGQLPEERLTLAGVVKRQDITFYDVKGIVEGLSSVLGIDNLNTKAHSTGGIGADVYIGQEKVGDIEVLEKDLINFELNFVKMSEKSNIHKKYTPLPKYPPVIEDVTLALPSGVEYTQVVENMKKVSTLLKQIDLLDTYENKKTFRLTYRDPNRNLSSKEIEEERKKIYKKLKDTLHAEIDE